MKFAAVLTFLSLAVMVAMIFQTVRQELQLRSLNTRTVADLAEGKKGEKVITLMKPQIKALKTNLASVMGRVEELKKRKAAAEKAVQEHQKSLQACGKEKENTERKKKTVIESINKFKADHAENKRKAEEEMRNLKQQILDRDKALCIFADQSFAEARHSPNKLKTPGMEYEEEEEEELDSQLNLALSNLMFELRWNLTLMTMRG
ncbi:uncharacterized protein si:dkey-87o1.2 isoform X1 [Syngnathoides biaculeatus]|uniref:uncharacterized protein si:dkey-87o1.2 isoform X1 n=1 Tax=Syngnathoides biaculeatus TaxID=300417 RepID=UPI002ADD536B|nr:uncharacterized protein si:dkey-87o1.2 isoform X1 [Syngnathoides biaculeatus]XP_061677240.1 uncharacterized protein si:dkey-87o1.2 isoform X1 [Syngnathoides biaculeatus]XP_061677241.1 uncharacterized protein si:dkey-87o1.2 isoform X1 [Syngnathoides biaculeatus]XP_061677243.1 uncharacterized protein si:dkey-87o1.2 isoform X1 [Syngnathoides biaculeatus]